ncbi:hypothetical protein [uncultured Sphingomonas sp.]|uniref:hypothetical protein n=1 Tax=uncultured Sphingomonas sp. TaxID=158754 RepID=UPI002597FECE|nr:hypothetical protein [uncultured Sphingomonas sp.]
MTDLKQRPVQTRYRNAQTGQFTVDGTYFKKQAKEALRTFVAPFAGVFHAVTHENTVAEVVKKKPTGSAMKKRYYVKKLAAKKARKRA